MYQKLLVPLDGSRQAESALQLAGKLAEIDHAELTLLRVVEYPFEIYARCSSNTRNAPGRTGEKLQNEKDAICRAAEDYLKELASSMKKNDLQVSVEVKESPVVDAILSTVDKSKIDLIVMSTVGQDESPWMMGSITNRILCEAQVPVIMIRKVSYVPTSDRHPSQSPLVQDEAWIHPGTLFY